MLKMMHGTWLSIVVFTAVAIGCASTGTGTQRALAPGDMASLAGTWVGRWTGDGNSLPFTLTISPDGQTVGQVGPYSAQGKAEIKDGALMLTSVSTSGGATGQTGQRTSRATLSERPDGVQVLTGFGHGDGGPSNYELTRRK